MAGMLEDLGISSLSMDWSGMMSQMWSALFWIMIILVVIAILFWWLWTRKFNKKVRLRVLTGTKKIIRDYKARELSVDGVKYWQTLKRPFKVWDPGDLMPVPPADAIDIGANGRIVVEAYATETGEYYFISDAGDKNIKENKDFKAFATNQRLMLIDQCKKANLKKPLKWTEHIGTIANAISVVILIIVVFVFWDSFTAPALQAQQNHQAIIAEYKEITDNQKEIMEIWREIKFNQQKIEAENTATQETRPPN